MNQSYILTQEIIENYRLICRKEPRNIENWLMLGRCLVDTQQFDQAEEALTKIFEAGRFFSFKNGVPRLRPAALLHWRRNRLLFAKAYADMAMISLNQANLAESERLLTMALTVFEKENEPGGIVKNVIPEFRIASDAIAKDVSFAKRMGAEFICGKEAPSLYELKAEGYEYILLAIGAQKHGALSIQGNVMNVIDFLYRAKNAPVTLALGNAIAVIGGGNTAMDAARAAKRMGIEKVSIVYRRTKKYMPADEEELALAMEDGVEFAELLAPVEQKDGMLVCKKMKLGGLDESGRRSVTETDETVTIPADTVIAAVGEKPDAEALRAYGAELNENGRAPFDCGAGVYTAGDVLRGPATVVEAIADARRFADAVIGFNKGYMVNPAAARDYRETLARKHKLMERQCGEAEARRCLGCSTVCENCVSSCPNRANAAIKVKGKAQRQIVHIDALCNECGNCAVFCPYSGRPYKDKLTVFADEASFTDSENNGFLLIDRESKTIKLRLNGEVSEVCMTKPNALERDIEAIILTVINDYGYML